MHIYIYIYIHVYFNTRRERERESERERERVCVVLQYVHTRVCVYIYIFMPPGKTDCKKHLHLGGTLLCTMLIDFLISNDTSVRVLLDVNFGLTAAKGNWHMRGRCRFMPGISESKIWRAWLGWHCLLGESADTAVRGFAFMFFSLLSHCISKRSASPVTQASKSQNTK